MYEVEIYLCCPKCNTHHKEKEIIKDDPKLSVMVIKDFECSNCDESIKYATWFYNK